MSGTDQPQLGGIITSDRVGAGRRRMRLIKTSAIGVVVSVLLSGGAYSLYRAGVLQMLGTSPSAQTQNTKPEPTDAQLAAIKKAQDQVAAAKTTQAQAQAYGQLGAAYLNAGQSSQAVTAYKQAVSNDGSSGSSNGGGGSSGGGGTTDSVQQISDLDALSNAYLADGDTKAAADALKQVISLLQASNDPEAQDTITRINNRIANLVGNGS